MFSLSFLRANANLIGFGFALCFISSVGQTYFISLFGGEIRAEFGLSHGGFGTGSEHGDADAGRARPALLGGGDKHVHA